MRNVYKFATWDIQELDTFKDSMPYKYMSKLNSGKALTRVEKDNIAVSTENGVWKLGGWLFDFNGYLNKYWVDVRHYGLIKTQQADKTAIRRKYGKHNVLQIQEVV